MARLRSVDKAYDYFKKIDPETALSKYQLRQLIKTRPDLFVWAGRRVMGDLDRLEAYFSTPEPKPLVEPEKIRRIN